MKKCSIMMIDDDEVDRYLLKRMLKKINISTEIFEAENGKEALDFLSNHKENTEKYPDDFPPILIFLDINMPIMNGFEFLEAFSELRKSRSDYTSSIFTMFTSSERDEDKEKADSYEFVKGFVVKGSLTPKKLKNIIHDTLSKI